MAITPLPTPPSRSQSPATFSTDADAFLGALPDFATEANALAADVNADEASAAASATTASNAASVAVGAANYQGDYNAGTTYQIGESVSYSGRRYVAKTINTGVTPADGANWFLINDGDVLGPVSATNNALALYDGTTGKIIKNGPAPGTAGNIIVSNGTTWASQAPPAVSGSVTATATGSIGNGQFVVLNGDGTVSIVSGARPSQGTPVQFAPTSGTTQTFASAAFDPVNNCILVVYYHFESGNNSLRCRIGTISGNAITFQSEQTILNGITCWEIGVHYNVTAACFLVGYARTDQSNWAFFRTIRISGTTVSIGPESGAVTADFCDPAMMTIPGTRQVIVFFVRADNLNNITGMRYELPATGTAAPTQLNFYGTIGGSPSSTAANASSNRSNTRLSISRLDDFWSSFGGAFAYVDTSGNLIVRTFSSGGSWSFLSVNSAVTAISSSSAEFAFCTWIPSINRLFVAGQAGGSSSGLLYSHSSGTLTQTASVSLNGPSGVIGPRFVLDTAANKILMTFQDVANSNFWTRNTIGFTESTLTLDTKAVIASLAPLASSLWTAYDSTNQRAVSFYERNAVVINSVTSTNMTAFNMIGAANGSYTNGQTATVQTIGAVNTGQAGLTPGSPRYIWADGTLNSIADPFLAFSVLAGTALTTTSIIVKA